MTTMILHDTTPLATGRWTSMKRSDLWQHSFAAGLAVALHGVVVLLLINNWSPEVPAVKPPNVMTTQLVMVAPTVQPPAPEPAPMPVAEPVVAAPAAVTPSVPVEPAKPQIDPQIQARKLEQAALARKRVEERQREQLAEQQRQQQASRVREQAAEQQRQAQQQAQQAEQSRLNAERARQQAAADSRQYLPLSKEAPEYPARALDKNIEGDCSVEYTVNPKGQIENPKVLDGCHPLFIRPSLAAAQTFRYQPRIVDGVAVAVPSVRNTFHFRIK
ncbi:energy transducer TonB [Pseudomonas sp. p50]|uniref:energy transducer TonB n=1 Tax=Pseudomonas sp. p50(2008) TaxID=2816832 RepID=UPI00188C5251|nr:energy transducer TonB [Pseudomonas sp. p50(2008)]MBF4559988.1 energy transducer TonB [Pseudomonas sp. p50(2008)]